MNLAKTNRTLRKLCILLAFGVISVHDSFAAINPTTGPRRPFKTHFQNESQFIVETIASDLAEQIFYAKYERLPDIQQFSVLSVENVNSSFDAPTYTITVTYETNRPSSKIELQISGPIWAPDNYRELAADLARNIGLEMSKPKGPVDTGLLSALVDSAASTIEKENQTLSEALEKDFRNSGLHEKAAILLGAFSLREHSGVFQDIRLPVCRMTAHLTMAQQLAGGKQLGINGQIAEGMLFTLMNNEAIALEILQTISTNDLTVVKWVRVLRAYNTGDYRPLEKLSNPSPIEQIASFHAFSKSVDVNVAWSKLTVTEKQILDNVRIAKGEGYSVETGHQLLVLSLPLETNEIKVVYEMSRGQKLNKSNMAKEMNALPERCFTIDENNRAKVLVIGWGQWAYFFQRHVCEAIKQDYDFLNNKWGVPDEAKEFSTNNDLIFGELRLFPFVRRFGCQNQASYQSSVDDGFEVANATPHLVPAGCWQGIYSAPVNFLSLPYLPNVFVWCEWYKHIVLPGTAYDPLPRTYGIMFARWGVYATNARLFITNAMRLHELAPYDGGITTWVLRTVYSGHPTFEQVEQTFKPIIPYSSYAADRLADMASDQPERYETLMASAAKLNPAQYATLGWYFRYKQQEDKAAKYFEMGNTYDPDSVRTSHYANWLVQYYLKHGERQKAQKVADAAGDVYSFSGLIAKAGFHEAIGEYQTAFGWYTNIENRYRDSNPIVTFCYRYKAKTGDRRFDTELEKRLPAIFPKGIENVSLNDFQLPPADGVRIWQEIDARLPHGSLKKGDVIVSVYGVRVHNINQYAVAREFSTNQELNLIVWQDKHYAEVKFTAPDHRFGMGISNVLPDSSPP